MRTKGLSNKIVPPVLAALAAFVGSWINDAQPSRPLAAALAVALIGAVAAYFTAADEVVSTDQPQPTTMNFTAPSLSFSSGGSLAAPIITKSTPETVVDDELEVGREAEATHALGQAPVMPSQVAPEGEPDEEDDPPHEGAPLDVIAADEPAPDLDAPPFRDPGVKGDLGA